MPVPGATSIPKNIMAPLQNPIARCLKGISDEKIIIKPDLNNLNLDFHVDTAFAGYWNPADPEDPSEVKSGTGFLLRFVGMPILWKSNVQDFIGLSTKESEYIAPSTAMHGLIYARALLFYTYAKSPWLMVRGFQL